MVKFIFVSGIFIFSNKKLKKNIEMANVFLKIETLSKLISTCSLCVVPSVWQGIGGGLE